MTSNPLTMTSNNDSRSDSPIHLGLTSQFSPNDIQELLGIMGDTGSDPDQGGETAVCPPYGAAAPLEREGTATTSSSASVGSNQPPATTAVAHACYPAEPGEEQKAQARSERKRSREKQRRSDVNKQFEDLTQLLHKIDAEDVNEKDGSPINRTAFNPANRVDLISRTIVLMDRLHDANKRRKTDIASLQQQLLQAKKAAEDTAAKLKEAVLAPPAQPMNKQFMMMVPMMMSSDRSGPTSAVPMMNPFMPQAAMQQPFCPMPMAAPVAGTVAASLGPASAQTGQAPVQAPIQAPTTSPHYQQQPQQQQQMMGTTASPYYMMPAGMPGGGFMIPVPAAPAMGGQPMAMMQAPAMATTTMQTGATTQQTQPQEQKDSSLADLNGGSNLAHCA